MPSSPSSFNCTPLNPCKRLLKLFKKPRICLRRVIHKMRPSSRSSRTTMRRSFRSIRAALRPLISRRPEDADKVDGELPVPTPVAPEDVNVKMGENERVDEVEEACRSFENYLMEMLVEERKVRDLMDVEELLLCWTSLNNPVFIELVCRFYGELCNDLFAGDESGNVVDEIISAAT